MKIYGGMGEIKRIPIPSRFNISKKTTCRRLIAYRGNALVEASAVRVVGANLAVFLPRARAGHRLGGRRGAGRDEASSECHSDEEG